MKNEIKFSSIKILLIAIALPACVPNVGNKARTRNIANAIVGSANVGLGQGRVLADNPIIVSKNASLPDSYDLNRLLSTVQITSNPFLTGNQACDGLDYCFEVREVKEAPSPLQTANGKWAYNANSLEFLQVNTFYHLNKVTDHFYTNLYQSIDRDYVQNPSQYETSLSQSLVNQANNKLRLITKPLVAYANCDEADNAYFERSTQTLCFGYITDHPTVKWAQDSTAIYHETGHFFQKLQLNLRNSIIGPQVDMGNLSYDEAGAIGEGLSDFYSYYINGRTHFAEWGAGRFLNASRPISERDPMHVVGISTDPDQRLSYPQYLNYNPNDPTIPIEDIHYAGMIISHYLVALSEDLQDKCLMQKTDSSDFVMHLISETLAELGDLTSVGTQGVTNNGTSGKINLNADRSSDWYRIANPLNYRSFIQTFAKNLKNNLSNPNLNRCNGGIYSQDQIESLIDQYGLLLFRTYNENRNLAIPGVKSNTAVNAVNRKKSVLISKNFLIFDPTPNASTAYVIDNRAQIKDLVASLQSGLLIGNLSPQTPSDFGFNNDNGRISPGEVVAVALNLYNNSNSVMGGVQVLANDWNQSDPTTGRPYLFPTTMANDQWPLVSEGGVAFPFTTVAGVKTYNPITTSTATDAPVCYIQSNDASATTWISQSAFRAKVALDQSFCLDPAKPNECFFRAIKGADQSHYSKINPKSTWGQTVADPETGKAGSLGRGNVILFEVSKHIPPGTIIDCRLRVRFTNCEDCYHDANKSNYDFSDNEYNGPRPYKIVHLQVPIND